jgi:hypothetical protein
MSSGTPLSLVPSGENERELQPLEVAVHLLEARLAQPVELLAETRETIGRIVLRASDGVAEALV